VLFNQAFHGKIDPDMNQYFFIAASAFVVGLLLTFLAVKFFPRLKMLDRPHLYGLKRSPIPYYGGIAIFVAFVVLTTFFVQLDEQRVLGLVIGGGIVFVIGLLDDIFNLPAWIRLGFQLLAAIVLVVFGVGIYSINLPFLGALDFTTVVWQGIPLISAIFTIVWVLVIVNAMNLVDGISGISSGVSSIAALTIFFLSIHPGVHENPETQLGVAMIALIVSMVALAFFLFDFPKPKILMGDSGSTFLGFVLASLAIFSGGKVATAFLVLGIPIVDMTWAFFRRTLAGKKFWEGDLLHMHHRLNDIGLPERMIVFLYMFITAVFGTGAVMLVSSKQKFFMILGLVLLLLVLIGALIFIPKRRR